MWVSGQWEGSELRGEKKGSKPTKAFRRVLCFQDQNGMRGSPRPGKGIELSKLEMGVSDVSKVILPREVRLQSIGWWEAVPGLSDGWTKFPGQVSRGGGCF